MITGLNKWTVLVVDDEEAARGAICEALEGEGYDITSSPNAPDAIVKISQMRFDMAILDILMPDMSGFELMGVMNKMCPETIIVVLTAMLDPDSQFGSTAETSGVFAYLRKPCKLKDLKETLQGALDYKRTLT